MGTAVDDIPEPRSRAKLDSFSRPEATGGDMMNDEGKEQLITAEQNSMGIAMGKRKNCEESKEGSFVARQRNGRARQGLADKDWKFFHHLSRAPALCSFWCAACGWFPSPLLNHLPTSERMRGMVVLVGFFFSYIGGVSCPPTFSALGFWSWPNFTHEPLTSHMPSHCTQGLNQSSLLRPLCPGQSWTNAFIPQKSALYPTTTSNFGVMMAVDGGLEDQLLRYFGVY